MYRRCCISCYLCRTLFRRQCNGKRCSSALFHNADKLACLSLDNNELGDPGTRRDESSLFTAAHSPPCLSISCFPLSTSILAIIFCLIQQTTHPMTMRADISVSSSVTHQPHQKLNLHNNNNNNIPAEIMCLSSFCTDKKHILVTALVCC